MISTMNFPGEGVPPGGGVHNMLRVRVCAAHMGGFMGSRFSKQGSFSRQVSVNMTGRNRQKTVNMG